jgi:hypothetical protein
VQGMTLKQYAIFQHQQIAEGLRKLFAMTPEEKGTPEWRHAFIVLSLQFHASKGSVPKRRWIRWKHVTQKP